MKEVDVKLNTGQIEMIEEALQLLRVTYDGSTIIGKIRLRDVKSLARKMHEAKEDAETP